jgi:uncharacterized protein involved in exopolysaccharide biosynthesis
MRGGRDWAIAMETRANRRSFAYVIFRHRRFLMIFFALCWLGNAAYVVLAPLKYESDAQVMVKVNFSNPDPARPDMSGGPGTGTTAQPQQPSEDIMKSLIVSYKALATNQEIERQVVEKMSVDRLYPTLRNSWYMQYWFTGAPLDRAIELFDNDIDVQELKESNVLKLSVFNHDPLIAQQTANLLLSEFISRQQNVYRSPATSFVGGQLDTASTDSRNANNELTQFKLKRQLTSITDERSQLLTERTDIADNLDNARSALSAASSRRAALEQSLARFSDQATTGNGTDAMSRQLDDAQARLTAQIEHANEERVAYPESSPLVKNADLAVKEARQRLAEIKAETSQTVRSGASPVYQSLQTDMLRSAAEESAAKSQVTTITADLAAINARLLELNESEGPLRELESRAQVAQDNLTTQLQRVVESRISSDLNKSQLTSLAIIQKPTLGYKPARPRWKLTTALAAFTGLFGGIALCFVLESMEETVGLPEQVEQAIGVPILATINAVPARR